MCLTVPGLVVDLYFIREHVHLEPIVPPDRNHMAAEIIDLGFDRATSLRTDESLVSADAACRLTTLSLTLLRHFFRSSRRVVLLMSFEGKLGAKLKAVQAPTPALLCHSCGTIRRPNALVAGTRLQQSISVRGSGKN